MNVRLSLVLGLGLVGWGLPVLAHGVVLEHRQVGSVEVVAQYETGEPMANAQVVVYAPDNPTEAWQQGTTDDQGRFSFVPDETLPGSWEVMVRQAGHGGVMTIPVSAAMADGAPPGEPDEASDSPARAEGTELEPNSGPNSVISPRTSLSPVQRGITIGSVIWGFVGTALFFARGKR
ncbi:carboxypeptidase-like regulatory domain-containing protein [Nodosilinea sp. PGN35]|uniref:carboxypeptidase-like regulatory domain-containing protein n=1 Tax=Nodosilinea sp. PGN35 TaxID=3020489 RepID=UPI0023B22594|nr:carboxypeptidase-like regulatory domain-containing protein [Nodosilinea sp. TSF1-S3]MDF0368323.1 carboxypeptidase-like regulatory domain-containing protein [Nodosilinea sp. TSF1-S3]